MSSSPVYFGNAKTAFCQIQNSDASNLITLYTPSGGAKVESLCVTSNDTTARDVSLIITNGGIDYTLGTMQIPINAGSINSTSAVDLLNSWQMPWARLDENGNRCLLLDSGCALKVKSLTTVTSGKAVQFFAQVREV